MQPPAMIIIMYCALSCAAYWRTDDYVKRLQQTCRVGQTNKQTSKALKGSRDDLAGLVGSQDDLSGGLTSNNKIGGFWNARVHSSTKYADTHIEMAVKTKPTSSPTTSELAATAADSSGSSYVEFMKGRRREYMADNRYNALTQAEITDLILSDWKALRARQRSS